MKNYTVYNENEEYFSMFGEIASGELIEKNLNFIPIYLGFRMKKKLFLTLIK